MATVGAPSLYSSVRCGLDHPGVVMAGGIAVAVWAAAAQLAKSDCGRQEPSLSVHSFFHSFLMGCETATAPKARYTETALVVRFGSFASVWLDHVDFRSTRATDILRSAGCLKVPIAVISTGVRGRFDALKMYRLVLKKDLPFAQVLELAMPRARVPPNMSVRMATPSRCRHDSLLPMISSYKSASVSANRDGFNLLLRVPVG
jgi:hypothetical protein